MSSLKKLHSTEAGETENKYGTKAEYASATVDN